ncbi:MAG TPA: nuclear transport factor 2 family protein [Aromatoleum sp.]|uniref:nuclear transport factor 2 family protein n=1 Tax=Aromatoleum sp. TaxID=2307007 RepID=UPI002B46329D|nr:nuclear transport factor 2 family protein [Aromatoleum sp.]HJV27643.1 nuclear transport factor 2 family protein [Aromatoleum sp.]
MDIEHRIARLEALEAIRQLKHRYLNACDLKEVESIRDCFAEGPIVVDYEGVGRFEDRDRFVALYQSLACHPRVLDSHHGANPEIELVDADSARGRWALAYFNVDAETGATRRLGLVYADEYRRINGHWKIVVTRTRLISAVAGEPRQPVPA